LFGHDQPGQSCDKALAKAALDGAGWRKWSRKGKGPPEREDYSESTPTQCKQRECSCRSPKERHWQLAQGRGGARFGALEFRPGRSLSTLRFFAQAPRRQRDLGGGNEAQPFLRQRGGWQGSTARREPRAAMHEQKHRVVGRAAAPTGLATQARLWCVVVRPSPGTSGPASECPEDDFCEEPRVLRQEGVQAAAPQRRLRQRAGAMGCAKARHGFVGSSAPSQAGRASKPSVVLRRAAPRSCLAAVPAVRELSVAGRAAAPAGSDRRIAGRAARRIRKLSKYMFIIYV